MPEKKEAAPGTPARGGYALGWGELSVDWAPEPLLYHGGSNQKNLAYIWLEPRARLRDGPRHEHRRGEGRRGADDARIRAVREVRGVEALTRGLALASTLGPVSIVRGGLSDRQRRCGEWGRHAG